MKIIKTRTQFWNFVLYKTVLLFSRYINWKKILISFRRSKRYNFGIIILKHIAVYKEKGIRQFTKCCRKNLFRYQTVPGICWSSATAGHCSKNSNRYWIKSQGYLHRGRKIVAPGSRLKILEGGTTFRLVTLHAEISVHEVNDCSKRPAAIFVWFVPSTRNFLVKAVYMVLESS